MVDPGGQHDVAAGRRRTEHVDALWTTKEQGTPPVPGGTTRRAGDRLGRTARYPPEMPSIVPTALRSPSRRHLRVAALTALVTNIVIVFTGGIVRVSGSGLGCSDWPTCDGSNITPMPGGGHAAWQGYVEFGNRLLSVPVLLAAVVVWWFVRRTGPHPAVVRRLALLLPLGVLGQIVLGGITVLTGLSPVTVAAHFLVSMVLIAAAAGVYELVREPEREPPAARGVQHAMSAIIVVSIVVLFLGTLVTGTGPHGGDLNAPRFGFDLRIMAIAHADAVWLLLGLTAATVAVTWRTGPARFRRTVRLLLVLQLAQGGLGYLQYWLGVPPTLVSLHIVGATVMWTVAVLAWARARDHTSLVGTQIRQPGGGRPASRLSDTDHLTEQPSERPAGHLAEGPTDHLTDQPAEQPVDRLSGPSPLLPTDPTVSGTP
jgi:heme a synthase